MNKKKILASTMTSVMAISSAATSLMSMAALDATFNDEYATRGDLQALLDSDRITELRDGKVDEYGSVSGANFLKAIEFAENLLASSNDSGTTGTTSNAKIKPEDYTAAYQMVKAAEAKLVQHDKIELQGKLAEYFEVYDSNNFLNDHGDLWFYENIPTNAWENFEEAYDNADAVRDSDDLLETTDAYEELVSAREKLNPKPTVTKQRATAARQAYEKIQQMEFKYQPWQRAKVTSGAYKGKEFAWGVLYEHIMSANTGLIAEIDEFTQIKNYNKTSDDDIVTAVETMEKAVEIINAFSSSLETGSDSKIKKLLAQYHGQLAYTYGADYAEALVSNLISVAGETVTVKDQPVDGHAEADLQFLVSLGVYRDGNSIDGDGTSVVPGTTAKADFWKSVITSNKTIEAELNIKLKASAATDLFYILDNDYVLPNGKNALYYTGTLGTDAVFFYTSHDDAKAVAVAAGIPESYVKTFRKGGAAVVFSDHIPVGGDEAFAATNLPMGTLDEAGPAANCVSSIKAAITNTNVSAAWAALSTAAKAVTLDHSDLTSLGNALADVTSVNVDKATQIFNVMVKVNALSEAVHNLDTACAAADTSAEIDGKDKLQAVADAEAKVEAAYKAVTEAAKAAKLLAAGDVTAVNAISNDMKPITDLFGKDATDFPAIQNAYNAAWTNEAVSLVLASEVWATYSNTTDHPGNGTNIFDKQDMTGTWILSFVPTNGTEQFNNPAYSSSRNETEGDGKSSLTDVSVEVALIMYDGFKDKNWGTVKRLDNQVSFVTGKEMSGTTVQSEAWKLLYNYMSYAIHDAFDASAGKMYTLKDVEDLIKKADVLDDETDEVSLFSVAHDAMVQDRTGAIEWAKLANADDVKNKIPRYADFISKYSVATKKAAALYESDGMYDELWESYDQLSKELKAFNYSFGDIIAKIAEISNRVDKKEFSEAATAKIKTALEETANAMLKLGDTELTTTSEDIIEDTALFNGDGTINRNNRLFTNNGNFDGLATELTDSGSFVKIKVAANSLHQALNKEYTALLTAYEDAIKELEKPKDELVYDVNTDGKIDVKDAVALFNLVMADPTSYDKKHDYNKDNARNVMDVVALVNKAMEEAMKG